MSQHRTERAGNAPEPSDPDHIRAGIAATRAELGDTVDQLAAKLDLKAQPQQAAHRAFWQLTARGDNPRHFVVADGKDPADLLQTRGANALRVGLGSAVLLADSVITARTAMWADRWEPSKVVCSPPAPPPRSSPPCPQSSGRRS